MLKVEHYLIKKLKFDRNKILFFYKISFVPYKIVTRFSNPLEIGSKRWLFEPISKILEIAFSKIRLIGEFEPPGA